MKNRRPRKLFLIVLASLILLGAMSFPVYMKLREYTGLFVSIWQEKAGLEEDRLKLARLQELSREEASINGFADSGKAMMPDAPAEGELIGYIQGLAREVNADFIEIRFDARVKGKEYSEMPLTIIFEGSYSDFVSFIEKIRDGGRAVRLDGINAAAAESGGSEIRAELTARAFYREGS